MAIKQTVRQVTQRALPENTHNWHHDQSWRAWWNHLTYRVHHQSFPAKPLIHRNCWDFRQKKWPDAGHAKLFLDALRHFPSQECPVGVPLLLLSLFAVRVAISGFKISLRNSSASQPLALLGPLTSPPSPPRRPLNQFRAFHHVVCASRAPCTRAFLPSRWLLITAVVSEDQCIQVSASLD